MAVAKGPETRWVYFVVFWLCGEFVGAGGASTLCPNAASRKKCRPGEGYSNPRCDECRTLPNCEEGEELQCSGTIDFNFFCKKCPDGTYLDGKTGCCTAWTDCSGNGLQTVQPGNRTHNVQCGIVLSTVETDSMFTNVLAIVTAAGIFLVILMMFSLLLCMWVQKREKLPDMEDSEAVDASNHVQLPQQHEESFSCQYPEEERGHKMAEERDSMPFLAH
ncbi:tumor necrosis factor receptor superfamily member 18 [Heteronotia binoei]|uniref:tumor necrosis factor receptor superfamily member 18 n=1 Tax=Heteronotia binoei TaxID=13085 RepID=UPI0029311238|nr:tumor necrosis factor receptor superfamily member 18 [Heteronotia binoei]